VLANGHNDLIILEVMLPRLDGWTILSRLRACRHETPVLMLTERDHVQDRVRALEFGADGYLVKPLAFSGVGASPEDIPVDARDRDSARFHEILDTIHIGYLSRERSVPAKRSVEPR